MHDKLINLFLIIFTFLSPIWVSVIGILLLVIIDLITGIWGAWNKGEKIESKKMRATIGKFIAYFLLILLSHIFDQLFLIPFIGRTLFLPFMNFFIASIEFKSAIENFQKILGIPNLWEKIKEFLAHNKSNK